MGSILQGQEIHMVFANRDLLLHDLDVFSIYSSASRCVAPSTSGEDAHMTCRIMGDFGGPTLNQPRL